jgi:hypothetical protein
MFHSDKEPAQELANVEIGVVSEEDGFDKEMRISWNTASR